MHVISADYEKVLENSTFSYKDDHNFLIILTKSPAIFRFRGENHRLEGQQLLCCRPGQDVEIIPTEHYLILDYVEFSAEDNPEIEQLLLPDRKPVQPSHFFELAGYLRHIYHMYYSADRYRLQKMAGFLQILLYSVASGDELPADQSHTGLLLHRLRQLRRLISDDPTAYKTVEEAAAFVGLSPSRFQHLYQQYFKISYINDRIRSKMFRARSLLKDTDWTVARIAQHLGYETEAFFSRQFKQRNGVSPAVYRKMNG